MSIKAVSWALEQKLSDPVGKLILIAIADRYNDEYGYAWPSVTWLSIVGDCSERTVRRKLRQFEEADIIATTKRHNETSCYYLPQLYKNWGDTAMSGGDTVSGGDTAMSGQTPSGGTQLCPVNNTLLNNTYKKAASKIVKLTDWQPDEDDKKYAGELNIDWQEVLTDIRLWDEKNGNKAKYASCRAFWQTWCRKEAKAPQRRLNSQQSGNKGWQDMSKSVSNGKKQFTHDEWADLKPAMQDFYKKNRPDADPSYRERFNR